ncbi:hypothetical protein TIFTF001_039180 [Ficus carica]|uniref:Uncharacterized protein n=1 Tax=Ficus carica TaxID=3494 RepID=A0AA88E925_FICCA|nr:hypothetical protein TIFTF001_039180 [Ficus carica]
MLCYAMLCLVYVSNLSAMVDARWRGEAWRTVNRGKC